MLDDYKSRSKMHCTAALREVRNACQSGESWSDSSLMSEVSSRTTITELRLLLRYAPSRVIGSASRTSNSENIHHASILFLLDVRRFLIVAFSSTTKAVGHPSLSTIYQQLGPESRTRRLQGGYDGGPFLIYPTRDIISSLLRI